MRIVKPILCCISCGFVTGVWLLKVAISFSIAKQFSDVKCKMPGIYRPYPPPIWFPSLKTLTLQYNRGVERMYPLIPTKKNIPIFSTNYAGTLFGRLHPLSPLQSVLPPRNGKLRRLVPWYGMSVKGTDPRSSSSTSPAATAASPSCPGRALVCSHLRQEVSLLLRQLLSLS